MAIITGIGHKIAFILDRKEIQKVNSTFSEVLCLVHFPNYGTERWNPNRTMVSLGGGNKSQIKEAEVAEFEYQRGGSCMEKDL